MVSNSYLESLSRRRKYNEYYDFISETLYVPKSAVRRQIAPGCSHKWDSENRLVSVTIPHIDTKGVTRTPPIEDITVRMEYDGDGQRVRKETFYGTALKNETVYLYDQNGAVSEERNGLGESTRIVVAAILEIQGSDQAYFQKDGIDSTRVVTDALGIIVISRKYDPWGNIEFEQGRSSVRMGFTEKERDSETGLDYFGSRYYKPDIGRWISREVFPGKMKSPQSLNKYIYARNNPVIFIDLSGNREMTRREKGLASFYIGRKNFLLGDVNFHDILRQFNPKEGNNPGLALPGVVFIGPGFLDSPSGRALFIHELFHQYEYQNTDDAFKRLIGEFSKNMTDISYNPYNYGGVDSVKSFDDIKTLEGQAQFFYDFVLKGEEARKFLKTGQGQSALKEFKKAAKFARILQSAGFESKAITQVIERAGKGSGGDKSSQPSKK